MNQEQPSVVMPGVDKSPEKLSQKRSIVPYFLLGIGVVVALGLAGVGVVYRMQVRALSEAPWVIRTAEMFRTPAVLVAGEPVLYSDYMNDKKTIETYYKEANQGEVPFTSEEISDQIISRLVANAVVEQTAKKFAVEVNESDVATARAELVGSAGDETKLAEEINKLYGWTIDQYVDRIVRPMLLEQKLGQYILASTSTELVSFAKEQVRASHILFAIDEKTTEAAAKRKAEQAILQLATGKNFEDLARENNTDATKETGGDLNWFEKGMMVPAFDEAAFALEVGSSSKVPVKTEFGYHIVKTTDKRNVPDFRSYMEDRLRKTPIEFKLPIHDPFAAIFAPEQAMMEGEMQTGTASGTMQISQ